MVENIWQKQVRARLLAEPTSLEEGCVASAVLVAFVGREEGIQVVFTQRTMTVATHKGQVSLPGGVCESGDVDAMHTALREAEEEIGLSQSNVRVLGYLPGQRTVTDFWITPVVGIVNAPVPYRPAPDEVDAVFEVPLKSLMNKEAWVLEKREYQGKIYDDCRFSVGDRVIWGATGKIVYTMALRLLDVANVVLDP